MAEHMYQQTHCKPLFLELDVVWDDTVPVYMDVWSKIAVDEISGADTVSLMPEQHLDKKIIAEWMYMMDIMDIMGIIR